MASLVRVTQTEAQPSPSDVDEMFNRVLHTEDDVLAAAR